MTSQVFIATAALFVAAFAPTPLPNSKKAPEVKQTSSSEPPTRKGKHAKKGKHAGKGKASKGKKGGAKLQPLPGEPGATPLRFKPLLTKAQIARLAKVAAQTQHKPAPKTQDASSSVRTLATLTSKVPVQGAYSMSLVCASTVNFVEGGENGYGTWSEQIIEFCAERPSNAARIEIDFPAEANSVYAVDCNAYQASNFAIRHRAGGTLYLSPVSRITTDSPREVLFTTEAGRAGVRFSLEPTPDSAGGNSIETCRVRKIG